MCKAKIDQKQGDVLIPKNGLAPMLFLQYLRDNSLNNLIISRMNVMIETRLKFKDYFRVRFHNEDENYKIDLIDFININILNK